jgi:hypothetical protein
MARYAQAKIRRIAIFVKDWRGGSYAYDHRPYDVVEYDWGEGERKTYLQPHFGRTRSATLDDEIYNDVRFYSTPPEWDLTAPSKS